MKKDIKEKICHFTGRVRRRVWGWWWVVPQAEVLAGLARLQDSLRD